MKKSLRFLSLVAAMILLVSVVAGCSAEGSEQWEYAEDTSPFEFTAWWASMFGWAKGAVELGWDDSPVYKHIEEKTGTKMHIDLPTGKQEDLIAPMIASGTYPDVMVIRPYNSPFIKQMIDAGLVYSWTELINEYCPKMWDVIDDSQLVYHADDNGVLWYYVGMEYGDTWEKEAKKLGNDPVAGAAGNNIIFVRQDILKAFGKEDITTLDEFTDFLQFVKDNYPDVDALQLFDGSPSKNIFTHFGSTFGCHLSNTYPQADGTIKYYMYDPAYVEYLSWLNSLYRRGIITDNQLMYDTNMMDTKMYSGSYGAIMSATYTAYNTLEQTLKENYGEDTDKLYVAVGPIEKEGVEWKTAYTRSKGTYATLITKNAKNPERIIKFFEYLLTDEGQMTINAGVEGVDWWRNSDGTISHNQEKADLALNDLTEYTKQYKLSGNWAAWSKTGYWEGLLGALLTPPVGREIDENYKRLGPQYVVDIWKEGFADITDSIETGSDLDLINTKVSEACDIAGMKMVVAKTDEEFNSIYDACIKEIEALGVAEVEAAYTAEHLAQCERLGIEP